MKQILFSLIFVLIIAIGQDSFGQATAGQHDPYQNLGVYKIYNNNWQHPGELPPDYVWNNENDWYGTQSAPTALEKAQWGLDDINKYRTENGLKPYPKSIIKKDLRYLRVFDYILLIVFLLLNIFLFFFYVQEFIKSNKEKEEIFVDNKSDSLKKQEEKKQEERAVVNQFLSDVCDILEKPRKFDQTVQEIMCGKPIDTETFPIIWDGLVEQRRRANAGVFVQIYGREPTEIEIVTGKIETEIRS
jgi:uncharacterized protein YxeA